MLNLYYFVHYLTVIIVIIMMLFLTETLHVYREREEAIQVMKLGKSRRLKIFENYSDAVAYTKTGGKESFAYNHFTKIVTVPEQSSNFKSLTQAEIVAFKQNLVNNELEEVERKVWENPRYLISSGDTPAIYQVNIQLYNTIIFLFNFTI